MQLCLSAVVGAGCADEGPWVGPAPAPSVTLPPDSRPIGAVRLLTEPAGPHVRDYAIVTGVLGVNAKRCVTLQGGDDKKYVLIAPRGSRVLADGESFDLVGMGQFRLGDKVRGGGGWYDNMRRATMPDYLKPCVPSIGPANFVSIYSMDS